MPYLEYLEQFDVSYSLTFTIYINFVKESENICALSNQHQHSTLIDTFVIFESKFLKRKQKKKSRKILSSLKINFIIYIFFYKIYLSPSDVAWEEVNPHRLSEEGGRKIPIEFRSDDAAVAVDLRDHAPVCGTRPVDDF